MMRLLAALVLLATAIAAGPARAQTAFETAARAAILIDYRSGDVLFEKNPDEALPPASMSKLMTALVAFEELEAGNLQLDEELPVSERAWRMGGSRMFLEVGTRATVHELLQGIIVQSGNDACVVIAEALSGSEEAFADRLTKRGIEIGLTNTTLRNATGWPDPEHLMSVRDLSIVARQIISRFPQYYQYYSQLEFEFNGINQHNRNPLLQGGIPGVDGMKTGYTQEAGYGLVASAERDGRRLILVVAGLESSRQRRSESERLLEYGFRHFQEYRLFEPDAVVAEAPVWQGAEPTVPLVGADVVSITLTRAARDSLNVKVVYDSPVTAPVEAGQVVGQIEMTADGMPTRVLPLVAARPVERAGILGRMTGTLEYLIWGVPG
ncbi:MAG: D-alanyl-D-alanine carboxypeptidase family protein [Geminicoccaceae bacterium]|jgi:D-alanyl-D-alanine carboxypeptidase (penicillin-binding protein 5/6)|nr:D-alanyl-D-alanine carboxypeptidase [Geminicoccaceae bacterium]HRY22826.1 D-alanyl-D-alanine carboxypeptidase family protein [Geminicoccaceae bacterium]